MEKAGKLDFAEAARLRDAIKMFNNNQIQNLNKL